MYEWYDRFGKIDKIAGFFHYGWDDGIKTSDLWWLMQNSISGRGILNSEKYYTYRLEGSASLKEALDEVKPKFKRVDKPVKTDRDLCYVSTGLADIIELAHVIYHIDYAVMFKKYDIDSFVNDFNLAFGEYDDKIITRFLQ